MLNVIVVLWPGRETATAVAKRPWRRVTTCDVRDECGTRRKKSVAKTAEGPRKKNTAGSSSVYWIRTLTARTANHETRRVSVDNTSSRFSIPDRFSLELLVKKWFFSINYQCVPCPFICRIQGTRNILFRVY